MVEIRSKPTQLVLVLHTAVDYVYRQGAGIGVVQRAECATTGIIKNQLIPGQKRKYGITRENLVVENIKTAGRAQMFALVHALGLAHGTIKRGCPKAVQLQKVTVFSDSPKVVQTINHHIKYAPDSLRDAASTNDRSIIKRVIAGVRRLSRRGLEVAIAVPSGKDKAGGKARTMARQRGRKAYRSRRRLRLAHDNSVEEQEEAAGDQGTFELIIRAKESPRT
jgi:ribonuclease HI